MVRPSCPALVIHDDDAFRKRLIAALDENNFTVTFDSDGDGALETLGARTFNVVLLGINLQTSAGLRALEYLRTQKPHIKCGVIILGDPDPALRTYAPWADETLLKPVDPQYVVSRARSYCDCP